jgi:hypothetical protein
VEDATGFRQETHHLSIHILTIEAGIDNDDEVRLVLEQHAEFDIYSAS